MKNKKLHWILFGVFLKIVMLVALAAFAFVFMLVFYNPFLAPRMIKYYSNDDNYHHYRATIKECYEIGSIEIENIIHYEDCGPDGLILRESEPVNVFSLNIEQTWQDFSPYVGLEFDFIGNFRIFFDGGIGVVVQIMVDGNEILSFESGKEALLQWAATVY